jgi:hypothetical protein
MSIRPVKLIIKSEPTIEGAGVRLRRAFGFGDTREFAPSSYSMTSATSTRRTIVPDFHGTHTAASRQLSMC